MEFFHKEIILEKLPNFCIVISSSFLGITGRKVFLITNYSVTNILGSLICLALLLASYFIHYLKNSIIPGPNNFFLIVSKVK